MKLTLLTLTTLVLLSTSSCYILDDLELSDLEWKIEDVKYGFDPDLQTAEDDDENELDLTDLKDLRGIERSIITNILTSLLRKTIESLTNVTISSLNLGSEIGSLNDVTIYFNNSVVYDIEAGKGNNIKNMTITFENITVIGQYDIKSLKLPGPIIIYGKGDVFVHLENIIFSTGVDMSMVISCLKITGFPNFDLSIEKSTINFGGLMGGGPVGELLNKIISDALPKLILAIEGPLIEEAGPTIADKFLNPIINCIKNHIINPDDCFKQMPEPCT